MTQARMETAAERYRRLKQSKEELHDVTCTCGMVWKCRKADMQFWISSGIIPTNLAGVMVAAVRKGHITKEQFISSLNEEQLVQSIESSSKIVRYSAVEPRIVEHATEPNDVEYDEVMQCCYNRIRDWQWKGGDEADSLATFRQE